MNNLVVRTISGIVFIALLIFCVLWSPITYIILFSIIIAVMMNEYINITIGKQNNFFDRVLGIGAGVMLFLISFFVNAYGLNAKYLSIRS